MIDEYLWGNVDRISPEAPVQVVDVRREARTLGGAGNVIANLVSLGANVDVAGIIGDGPGAVWQGKRGPVSHFSSQIRVLSGKAVSR